MQAGTLRDTSPSVTGRDFGHPGAVQVAAAALEHAFDGHCPAEMHSSTLSQGQDAAPQGAVTDAVPSVVTAWVSVAGRPITASTVRMTSMRTNGIPALMCSLLITIPFRLFQDSHFIKQCMPGFLNDCMLRIYYHYNDNIYAPLGQQFHCSSSCLV